MIKEERTWAGSETSLQAALEAETSYQAKLSAGAAMDDNEEEDCPRLLSVQDGLATIEIKGPLVNSDSDWLEWFGLVGYGEIRDAMLAAANDPDVKQILLDIDSGGGAVSGCDDTARLIRLVNDRVKPVTAFTDGNMCSAAYWLGCSAGEVYSGKASLVGSIGIISTFREYSEANKMAGIGVTVLRAGKHKALANPNEKLTDAARAQIQKVLDAAYGVFVDHVANMRGRSYDYADKTMADGQEFIGQAAVDVGLTDGVTTFDTLITDLQKKVLDSEQKVFNNTSSTKLGVYGKSSEANNGEQEMAKRALTEADIAAMAAGAPVAAAASTEPVVTSEENQNGVQDEGAQASQVAEGEQATAQIETSASAEGAVVEDVAKLHASVQLLNEQLAAKDAALLKANVDLSKTQEALAAATSAHAPMLDIVAQSISNMSIAIGGPAYTLSGQDAANVLAEHTRISEQFKSKFHVGGVAAVSGEAAETTAAVSPRHMARVSAARFQPK